MSVDYRDQCQSEAPRQTGQPRSHPCTFCKREYKSKEALSRHRNTHSQRSKHICLICDVVFYRKDLLVRHNRIHGSPDVNSIPRARQRSAIACTNCRQQKIKCVGGFPCIACGRSNISCLQNRGSRRVSPSTNAANGVRDMEILGSADSHPRVLSEEAINQPLTDFGEDPMTSGDDTPGKQTSLRSSELNPFNKQIELMRDALCHEGSTIEDNAPRFTARLEDPLSGFIASADEISSLEHLLMPDVISGISDWPWLYEDAIFEPLLPDLSTPDPENNSLELPGLSPNNIIGRQDLETIAGNEGAPVSAVDNHTNPAYIPATPGTSFRSTTLTDSTGSDLQRDVIESHIEYAVANVNSPESSENTAYRVWARREGSRKVQNAFGLDALRSVSHDSRNALDRFVSLFFENFHPLCPIFWEQGFDSYQVSPVVYLSIVSIGARYAGEKAAQYGAMLHGRLRSLFLATMYPQPTADQRHVSLAFGLLITTAETYLGTEDNSSQAQQLLALLITQARRSGLFKAVRTSAHISGIPNPENGSSSIIPTLWINDEMKKRIAFQIFRLEGNLSSFASTRPLLSWEELHIDLPCSTYLWNISGYDWKRRTIEAIEQITRDHHHKFSDLVHLFLDRSTLVQNLDSEGLNLVLLAIQENLWRFCEDPNLLSRLGCDHSLTTYLAEEDGNGNHNDDFPMGAMKNLNFKLKEAISALRRWADSMATLSQLSSSPSERQSCLQSQIQFQTTFLRLNAPMDLLKGFASCIEENMDPEEVQRWIRSAKAHNAIRHCQQIWTLLRSEPRDIKMVRNHCDLSFLVALHHAALVVWVCAGANYGSVKRSNNHEHQLFEGRSLSSRDSRHMVLGFKKLLEDITPNSFRCSCIFTATSSLLEKAHPTFCDPEFD